MRRPGTKTFGLSEDEWTAIRIAIDGWRAAHPNLVASWYSVGDAILDAMNNGELVNENGIRIRPAKVVWCLGNRVAYTYQRNVLWCRLPSGRTLAYHRPRVRTKVDVQVADPEGRLGWVEESEAPRLLAKGCSLTDQKPRYKHNVLYEGYDNTMKRWTTFDLHGALAYQNVVQSIARDVMVEGMFAAEAHAYPIVLTVHDELLCDVPIGHGSTEELQRLMATVPEWCPGLPLAAKTWEGYRYEK
jgi:DNA polymerase